MKNVLVKILINTALGFVLIFIWSRFINLEEVFKTLKTADLKFIFLFFFLFFISGTLRAFRFKLLLSRYQLPWKDLTMLHFLSQFLSFMIPIRAGEITKSVYLTSQYNLPLAKTVVWVFIDRFLDLFVVLFFIATLLFFIPNGLPEQVTKGIFIALLIMFIVMIFLVKSQTVLKKIATFLSKFLIVDSIKSRFISLSHSIIEGGEILQHSPKTLFSVAGLSFLVVFLDSLIWFFIYQAFGYPLHILQSILANSMTALGYLIPAAPGYVGSTEAGALAVFGGVLGIEANLVSAAAVFFHILTILAVMIFGVGSLYFLKFDLKMVWKKIRKNE